MKIIRGNFWPILFVFFSSASIILNPYLIFGKPGQLMAFLLAVYSIVHGVSVHLWRKILSKIFILLGLSIVGMISSIFHGIDQFNHVAVVLSLIVIVLAGHGLWLICKRAGISTDQLVLLIFLAVLLNSLIIVLELNSDALRTVVESFLDPLDAGSINYTEGFRLRGIASSGGANLSLLIPAGTAMSLYLFKKKILGIAALVGSVLLLGFSATVIGRTGLILMPVPFIFYFVTELKKINARRVFSILAFLIFAVLTAQYLLSFGREFLAEKFGEGFLFYSFEFLFEGKQGLEQEGTAGIIAGFLQVLPTEILEICFGYGFYGGSDFEPWTDSGYSRMFLSIGYFFGLFFYFLILRVYFSVLRFDLFLILSFIFILMFGELKEPLLFSGFVSRVFLILVVFIVMDKFRDEAAARNHRAL